MSTTDFVVETQSRSDLGKGASRRLRHEGKVPAIIYGGDVEPQIVSIEHHKLVKQLESEAFYSQILTVNVDGKGTKAVLKDLQRHPSKPIVLHADFLRVSAKDKLHMNVPLHFINEDKAPGVAEGGLLTHSMNNVEIICQADQLPEYLEVDVAHLETGHALHLSDIKLPAGVELVALSHGPDHDLPVASIKTRGAVEEAPAEEEAAEEVSAEEKPEGDSAE